VVKALIHPLAAQMAVFLLFEIAGNLASYQQINGKLGGDSLSKLGFSMESLI